MKLIIAGSRTFINYPLLKETVDYFIVDAAEPVLIVSGGAIGTDRLGERYAKENHLELKIFPADWAQYGKGAGYVRNNQMAEYADACICFWDGRSKGTKMMIDIAMKKELYLQVINFKSPNE